MRSLRKSAQVLAWLLCLSGCAVDWTGHPKARLTSDEKAIAGVIAEMWESLQQQEETRLRSCCTESWSYYTAYGNKFDLAKLIAMHQADITGFKIAMKNPVYHVCADTAWATYDAEMSCLDRGKPWGGKFIITNIVVRTASGWKCAHMHESASKLW